MDWMFTAILVGAGLITLSILTSALAFRFGTPLLLVFLGIMSSLATDAGYLVLIPLAGAAFISVGRHPLAGLAAAFAAVAGVFLVNVFIVPIDGILVGITNDAIHIVDANKSVSLTSNFWFSAASVVVMTIVVALITDKIVEPHLGKYTGDEVAESAEMSAEETRGLRFAFWGLIGVIAFLALLTAPEGSPLRNPETGSIIGNSPFMNSLIVSIALLFFATGTAYGIGAGTIKTASDIPKLMQKGMSGAVSFLVVALPAACFVYLFNISNLTTILSVKGAEGLKALNLGGIPLLVLFILLCSFINLFMISGSAKWLILAPIFVPMFSLVGFSPALTQVAYRIGDSTTNIISPLSYYVPVVIGLLEQYKKESDPPVGIGTVVSLSMPYSLAFMAGMTLMLIVWYLVGLPLGPGAPVGM